MIKKNKRLNVCRIVFRFRHSLAFITVLVVVFLYQFVSCAEAELFNMYYRTFHTPSVSFMDYYSLSETIAPLKLDINKISSIYPAADTNLTAFSNSGSSGSFAEVWTSEQQNILFFDKYTGQTSDGNYTPLEFPLSECKHIVFSGSNYGVPQSWSDERYIYSPSGSTNIAFVDNFLVSDAPFYCFSQEQNQPYGNDYYISVPSANGLYCTTIQGFVYTTTLFFMFTDIPIYLSSVSGGSGFTNMSYEATDFSFGDSDNINFNYLQTEGIIDDPNAPEDPEVESDAKFNLTFRDSTYYSGDGLNRFYHNNNFTFTEYQINNPVYYRLKFSYRIEFANNLGVDDTYYYTPEDDVQLAYFLGQSNRLNTGSRLSVPLCSDWFKNGSGQTLTSAITATINSVTGENVQYINPNGLFENVFDWLAAVDNYVFGDGDGTPLQVVTPRYDGVITKFMVYGEVSLYNTVNSNYESFSFEDKHNFLTGKGSVVSTDNTIPPYEDSPVPDYVQTPISGGGGISNGSGSALAVIEKGANLINIYPSSGNSGGFMMPQQDWNEFGMLLTEMKTDLTTLTNDNGIMSTMNLIKTVTNGVLPDTPGSTPHKIWLLLAAGLAGSITIALWNKASQNH